MIVGENLEKSFPKQYRLMGWQSNNIRDRSLFMTGGGVGFKLLFTRNIFVAHPSCGGSKKFSLPLLSEKKTHSDPPQFPDSLPLINDHSLTGPYYRPVGFIQELSDD